MSLLPIFLDMRKQRCLVVGGGTVAARRIRRLQQAQARIFVVAPSVCPQIAELQAAGAITVWPRRFADTDIDHCQLVFAASDDSALNAHIAQLAKFRRIPVNVADTPELCSFIMPAIVDRSPVQIAISSGGTTPLLARQLRAQIETLIPHGYGQLATLMGEFRKRVKSRFANRVERRRFWERVVHGPIAELVFGGQLRSARSDIERLLVKPVNELSNGGEVYLVGAGPGDPDLLTFRALRLMQQTDVVVYDRLVAPGLVALARRDAERIYVGKQRAHHALSQDEINDLLIVQAQQGKRVLRLKGGDPFIFGRGGEEISRLADAGIPFQVVPGITAAAGCASYAGIPLTHRDYAQSCTFVTGHMQHGRLDLNWQALIQPRQTVVVYMGMGAMNELCTQLIKHGLAPTTPAALVVRGTTQEQRVLTADVATLPDIAQRNGVGPPGLIIIGDVVRLHSQLSWFDPQSAVQPQSAAQPQFGYSLSA